MNFCFISFNETGRVHSVFFVRFHFLPKYFQGTRKFNLFLTYLIKVLFRCFRRYTEICTTNGNAHNNKIREIVLVYKTTKLKLHTFV